ncbi:MAG: hypothetical protein JJ992_29115, partial [Planctomycetes bacterium]|nr:hypothetical protein [Planctomycetota bacterium]
MKHRASVKDEAFRERFEDMGVEPVDFGHREHVRLAYVYLCREQPERAYESMKRALLAFLERIGALGLNLTIDADFEL